MGKLVYSAITSLDGHVEDAAGNFDWGAPDEEVHAFVNELERPVGTHLYHRRMYETMRFWDTAHFEPQESPAAREYATIWQAADKVVFSATLGAVTTPRTRLERRFDPESVSRWKAASERDLTVGGAELAGHALRAGLVDEIQLLWVPVLVGGGKAALPAGVHLRLEQLETRRFGSGFVFLRYRVRPG